MCPGGFLLTPADEAAANGVVVWRMYYINVQKQELGIVKALA